MHTTANPATTAGTGTRLRLPLTLGAVAGLLAAAAVIETVIRQVPLASSEMFVLLLCLLGLVGTLPLALPHPVATAGLITSAGVLSVAAFDALTLAVILAQLIAAFGWAGGGRHRQQCCSDCRTCCCF